MPVLIEEHLTAAVRYRIAIHISSVNFCHFAFFVFFLKKFTP